MLNYFFNKVSFYTVIILAHPDVGVGDVARNFSYKFLCIFVLFIYCTKFGISYVETLRLACIKLFDIQMPFQK